MRLFWMEKDDQSSPALESKGEEISFSSSRRRKGQPQSNQLDHVNLFSKENYINLLEK